MLMARRSWNFDGWPSLDASAERFVVGRRSRKRFHLPAIVHSPLKGAKSRPFQPNGNEAFLKKFPQAAPD
jgi:hypothetical protein